jgi:hypothetical protein
MLKNSPTKLCEEHVYVSDLKGWTLNQKEYETMGFRHPIQNFKH